MRNPVSSLLSYLRVLSAASRNDPRNDAELLVRFVESQDETAFATLICRHGPLVWRTCRRILGDTPDAEDAFQVAFLALARKSSRVAIKSLAGWLHRVARQTALNADIVARRRKNLEQHLPAPTQSTAEEEIDRTELYAVPDEELAILPEQLRVPLVLRYLEGKTLEEVARIVGCSRPVVRKRLVRGEAILRKRLERRGLAVGIVSVGELLGSTVSAPGVPAHLIGNTARAAVAFRSGTLTGGAAEAARAVLAQVQ
jgi:RNA polymerase sigma factor (sigma-70 family)